MSRGPGGRRVIFVRIALAHRLMKRIFYNESENVCIGCAITAFTGYPSRFQSRIRVDDWRRWDKQHL
ncbi:hypothetical protein KCP70_14060 [Salmonella enterica subsp. enterica]|nr:hypothetical protein KCP70_14060 [Salmonella enterica subsp. enterica]